MPIIMLTAQGARQERGEVQVVLLLAKLQAELSEGCLMLTVILISLLPSEAMEPIIILLLVQMERQEGAEPNFIS